MPGPDAEIWHRRRAETFRRTGADFFEAAPRHLGALVYITEDLMARRNMARDSLTFAALMAWRLWTALRRLWLDRTPAAFAGMIHSRS